jgi:hypothetical protein
MNIPALYINYNVLSNPELCSSARMSTTVHFLLSHRNWTPISRNVSTQFVHGKGNRTNQDEMPKLVIR